MSLPLKHSSQLHSVFVVQSKLYTLIEENQLFAST